MAKHNAANTRMKRKYFDWLKDAKGRDEASIDAVAKALARFEDYTRHKDFKLFHIEQAKGFKSHLLAQKNARTGKPLSRATVHSTLSALRKFFIWLADKPSYKSRIDYSDADYFNLSEKDRRIAKASRQKPVPSLEQIEHVLKAMPADTDIDRRNRALIAFTILTGARDGALATLKMGHINLDEGYVDQDARVVKTKFSKTFTTWFFPVGDEPLAIVTDWCRQLREKLLWGDDDPLFPKTHIGIGDNGGFAAMGLSREHWASAEPIRKIFREAFEAAGLPYFNPHSFRDTLVQLGQRKCATPESFKAWSQNLGHEGVLTTFLSYGTVPAQKQGELIRDMGKAKLAEGHDRLAAVLAETLRNFDPAE
ncbi:MAG: tyrosine-type recombinase/integrase [Pseudomonadota bacterium]